MFNSDGNYDDGTAAAEWNFADTRFGDTSRCGLANLVGGNVGRKPHGTSSDSHRTSLVYRWGGRSIPTRRFDPGWFESIRAYHFFLSA